MTLPPQKLDIDCRSPSAGRKWRMSATECGNWFWRATEPPTIRKSLVIGCDAGSKSVSMALVDRAMNMQNPNIHKMLCIVVWNPLLSFCTLRISDSSNLVVRRARVSLDKDWNLWTKKIKSRKLNWLAWPRRTNWRCSSMNMKFIVIWW